MTNLLTRWTLTGAIALACSITPASEPLGSPRQVAPPQRIPDPLVQPLQPAGTPVTTATLPRDVRRAVVADAARRFAVAESAVVLSAAEQVTWGDGSLGCPRPGMSYTQALVPGFRVTATSPAGKLLYHTDTRGQVVTCAQPHRERTKLPRGHEPAAGPRTQPPVRTAPDR